MPLFEQCVSERAHLVSIEQTRNKQQKQMNCTTKLGETARN